MFYSFCGNKGGGKTFGLVHMIFDELRHTERVIFTNAPLKLGELQVYCEKHIQHKTVDVNKRICLLRPDQLFQFWLHYPGGELKGKIQIPVAGGSLEAPDFSPRQGDNGVVYIIDEAHIPFSSHNWAAVGKDALFYCTQERKLGDDTIFASQVPGQMAKPLRELMQEWTETRNMEMEPIFGCKFPGRFRWRTTLRMPTGGDRDVVLRRSIVKLDRELANCYDTLAGVGIVGRGSPETRTRGFGLRWQYYIGLLVLIVVVAIAALYYGVQYGVAKSKNLVISAIGIGPVGGAVPIAGAKVPPLAAPQPYQIPAGTNPLPGPVQFRTNETTEIKGNKLLGGYVAEPITVVGWSVAGKVFKAYLSDGRVVHGDDAKFKFFTKRGIQYDGEWFPVWERGVTISPAMTKDPRYRENGAAPAVRTNGISYTMPTS